jgi:hypothetical protein
MLKTFQSILEVTAIASASLEAYDLVGFDGAPVPGADASVFGFALSPAEDGDAFAVVPIGIIRIKASGAISAGQAVATVDAKTVKGVLADAASRFGIALTTAADGDYLDILIK